MSDGVSSVDVAAIRARCEAASTMVRRVCLASDQRLNCGWRIAGSPRPDADPDLVIAAALADVPALLDALAAAEAANARLREENHRQRIALRAYADSDNWGFLPTRFGSRDVFWVGTEDGVTLARAALGKAAPAGEANH